MNITEVYDRQFERVYRVAMLYLKNTSDAEDAAQTVFLKYIEKNKRFRDEIHEKAWFITVTRNLCRDMLKASWRKNASLSEIDEPAYEAEENSAFSVMMTLPAKYREVLYMYYYEGYTAREIASILKRSESTVQTQLFDGRKKLRQRLREEGFDER
ncbi:MAG: sigma-70 family RNA polymerase sigma factor [Ruminococcus sp.]|nr:sigma-70 family RNA polymerase sigma factor [Ruminococcus sp.]